ncbi:C-glycoside deglycosidase beta subunit domain-containing protein [Actinomyces urogenitalis]|uniref:C-glycoside deglycosidase beta subunit domain-containing protein n=1 Tax=Actinomyces urogenitalis TaxID=103621 RepID=UPI00242D721C|nr:DUF6379 domain-containing protein [Actinomyces urogenitalis]MCI7458095.1 DUF6379 domain-containing protein [Actinomyces urogenitalis]
MPTKFMKLGFDEKVLRRLANETEGDTSTGYVLDVGFNYYRGTPMSAVERLELSVDGERVNDDRILVEVNGKFLRISQLPLAFTEYWGVKTPIRLHVSGEPLSPGEHDVDLVCECRVVYMEFAPGIFGMLDASARKTLTVEE